MGCNNNKEGNGAHWNTQFFNRDEETRTIEWGSVIEWVREWEAKEPVNVDADARSPVWWMTEGEGERKKKKGRKRKGGSVQIHSKHSDSLFLSVCFEVGFRTASRQAGTSVSNNLDKFVLSSLPPPPPLILQLKKFSFSYTPCTHPPQDHLLIIFASAKVYKYYNTAMEIVNAPTQRLGRQAGGRQCARRSFATQISSSVAGSLLLLIQLLKIANSR